MVVAAITAIAGVWLRAHSSRLQWDNDEGIYLQQAWALMQGHRLYRDIWIDHPPGFPYALAAAFALFGRNMATARTLALVASLIGVPAVALLGSRLGGAPAGIAAALTLVVTPHFFWLSRSINPDLPAMALAVLGLGIVWRTADRPPAGPTAAAHERFYEGRRLALLALAGALLASGASIKLIVGVVGAPVAVLLAAGGVSRALRDAGAMAGGAALVVATWLLAASPEEVLAGALGTTAAARAAFPPRALEYAQWLVTDNLAGENLGLTALAGLGLLGVARLSRRDTLAMTAWCAATAAALILQRPMWPKHHWSLVLWPLSILSGVAVAATVRVLRDRRGDTVRRRDVAAAGIAWAVWASAMPATVRQLRELADPPQFAAVEDGVRWIADNLPADARVISDNGVVSFLAGRPMPVYAVPVSSKRLRIGDLTGPELARAAEREDVAAVLSWNNQLDDLPEFTAYLPTRFLRVAVVGDDREIWQRFDEAALDRRLDARSPGTADLLGASFEPKRTALAAGEAVTVTLVWRAYGPTRADTAVFLHILDSSGTTVAQADAGAGDGPSTGWQPDELLVGRHHLVVPEVYGSGAGAGGPAAPGSGADEARPATLVAGLYRRDTQERLPLFRRSGDRWALDRVPIGEIQLQSGR